MRKRSSTFKDQQGSLTLKKKSKRPEYRSSSQGRANLTAATRHARTAIRSIRKRKISIGAVGSIKASMAERSGGAVESRAGNSSAVNSASMSQRRMKMKKWLKTTRTTKKRSRSTCVAHVARKLAIQQKIAPEIPTSRPMQRQTKNSNASKR